MGKLRSQQVHGFHLLLLAAWLLGACAPASQAPPSPTSSPRPPTSPTPAYRLRLEAYLLPGETSEEWIVIGLAQTGVEPVADPRVRIVLSDRSGAEIDRRTIGLPLDIVPAGAGWPFRETFRLAATPVSVEAFLTGETAPVEPVPPASAKVLQTFLDAQGSTIALGRLTVDSLDVVEILAVRLLGRDPNGAMVDVLEAHPARAVDFATPTLPFLARVPKSSRATTWEAFPIVRNGDGLPPSVEPRLSEPSVDDQGNLFITAVLDNFGDDPLWARATGVVAQDGRWLAADLVEVPV
ncbi:MAG TPA: hypothetical protein VLL77_06435, partial [Anaerolineales bacterium]|nr:hypothetical protein [Anaerolineales bacterium]